MTTQHQYMQGWRDAELYVLKSILWSPGNASYAAKEYMREHGLSFEDVVNAHAPRRPQESR